jgi:hypothetical protein
MIVGVTRRVRDYTPMLEAAIAEAKAAGVEAEAGELENICFRTAYTTSSELLGEHGLAIKRFLRATRGRLPRATEQKLYACLHETALVWPGWRNLIVYLKGKI